MPQRVLFLLSIKSNNESRTLLTAELELYLELCKFHDAMMVCSVSDREKLLDYARSIYWADPRNDNRLPEYVTLAALGGMEQVQAVQFALRDEDEFFEMGNNGGDGFHSIRISAESFWSTDMISLASCGMLLL